MKLIVTLIADTIINEIPTEIEKSIQSEIFIEIEFFHVNEISIISEIIRFQFSPKFVSFLNTKDSYSFLNVKSFIQFGTNKNTISVNKGKRKIDFI
jgi:hypothetical protein